MNAIANLVDWGGLKAEVHNFGQTLQNNSSTQKNSEEKILE